MLGAGHTCRRQASEWNEETVKRRQIWGDVKDDSEDAAATACPAALLSALSLHLATA